MELSGREVIEHFASRSEAARRRLDAWRCDVTKRDVVPVVTAHVSRSVLSITPDEVIEVCHRTEHALGNIEKSLVSNIEQVRDWHPPFAFTHTLHFAAEAFGALPTYQEFRSFCRESALGQRALWTPATELLNRLSRIRQPQLIQGAIRWRVGNAYYSFLREMYVLAVLRDLGVDARVHPMADALFRVDLWIGDTNVSLFIGNAKFRSGGWGRKARPEEVLASADPPFRFASLELPTQHRFGEVHLPRRAVIERAVSTIEAN